MAIESAIMFMFIVFMFGLLLTGITMTSHLRVKVNDTLLTRELEIEQIGEYFIHIDNEAKLHEAMGELTDKYTATITDNTLTVTRKNSEIILLKVTRENGKITSWKYSNNEDNKNG